MNMYKFDDVVNAVLNESDDVLKSKLSEYLTDCYNTTFSNSLYTLCIENKRYEQAKVFINAQSCLYAKLYSPAWREKTNQYISDMISYNFNGKEEITYLIIYHLIKNRCYELLKKYLDMLKLFELRNRHTASLMGVAVKNKDTDALRLFIERGFCFNENDIEYLKNSDENYFNETVMRELEKHSGKRDIEPFAVCYEFDECLFY